MRPKAFYDIVGTLTSLAATFDLLTAACGAERLMATRPPLGSVRTSRPAACQTPAVASRNSTCRSLSRNTVTRSGGRRRSAGDDAALARLCGRAAHDATSLSIAGLYNPSLRAADPEVLRKLGLAEDRLPALLPVRTPAGRQLWSQVGGFHRMLATDSAESRFDFAARKDLYTAYIPFAVAGGAAAAWAAKYQAVSISVESSWEPLVRFVFELERSLLLPLPSVAPMIGVWSQASVFSQLNQQSF